MASYDIKTIHDELKCIETSTHMIRVGHAAMVLGKYMGLGEISMYNMYYGAMLHDLGKIKMPKEILHKPTALTEEEYEIVKKHPKDGYELCKEMCGKTDFADILYQHHERWDGNGYPQGLEKYEIGIEARIVALCDVFDSLVSNRSYKKGWEIQEAKQYVVDMSGKAFDPEVVQTFEECYDEIKEMY